MGKVIDFFQAKEYVNNHPFNSGSGEICQRISTEFGDIMLAPSFITPERIIESDATTTGFFSALTKQGKLTIISSSPEINLISVMRVVDPDTHEIHQILVSDFISETPIKNNDNLPQDLFAYIYEQLKMLDIEVHTEISSDVIYREYLLSQEEADKFSANRLFISSKDDENFKYSHDCRIKTSDGRYVVVKPEYFINPEKTKLLFMLMHARETYLRSGYSIDEEVTMEIRIREGEYVDTTKIPLSFIDTIIVNDINRSNPLHALRHLSPDELMYEYYQKEVIPSLSPLSEENYGEE